MGRMMSNREVALTAIDDEKGRRWRRTELTGPGVTKGRFGNAVAGLRSDGRRTALATTRPTSCEGHALTGEDLARYHLLDRLEKMDAIGLISAKAAMKRSIQSRIQGDYVGDVWTDIDRTIWPQGKGLGILHRNHRPS